MNYQLQNRAARAVDALQKATSPHAIAQATREGLDVKAALERQLIDDGVLGLIKQAQMNPKNTIGMWKADPVRDQDPPRSPRSI